jgi:hypothetical protein
MAPTPYTPQDIHYKCVFSMSSMKQCNFILKRMKHLQTYKIKLHSKRTMHRHLQTYKIELYQTKLHHQKKKNTNIKSFGFWNSLMSIINTKRRWWRKLTLIKLQWKTFCASAMFWNASVMLQSEIVVAKHKCNWAPQTQMCKGLQK